ncbi:MAG: hypothetical protein Q9164_004816 [Protoblastenia rupestris]
MRHRSTSLLSLMTFLTLHLLTDHVPLILAQTCKAGSATQIKGNWYCSEVKAIAYSDFPGKGYYDRVVGMDTRSGECEQERWGYEGSLSPLNEEVAVYNFEKSVGGKEKEKGKHGIENGQQHRLGHQKLHNRNGREKKKQREESEKRAVRDFVEVTMDGKLVSWTNVYDGTASATNDALTDVAVEVEEKVAVKPTMSSKYASDDQGFSYPAASTSAFLPKQTESGSGSGRWTRQAYYGADEGMSDGFTFLNHFGGAKGIPGTSAGGPAFGASLSYASSNGQYGAASSRVLENAMIEDNVEVIMLSNQTCNDGGCGYTHPGGVAYHGFGGSHKVFLFEFSMPLTGKSNFNGDMPAIWLLNAQIPLTSQYGTNADCSCWTSGCGEFDLFEVLDPGNMRCKSTLHMAPAGGSSDWFLRPMKETITAAVVFSADAGLAVIRVLDGEHRFDENLADETVMGWIKKGKAMSLFKMGS